MKRKDRKPRCPCCKSEMTRRDKVMMDEGVVEYLECKRCLEKVVYIGKKWYKF